MPDLIGMDYSTKVIEQATALLAQRGVLVDHQEETTDSHKLYVIGLGNSRKATATVSKSETELTPEQIETLSQEILESVQSQLRSGQGVWTDESE